MILYFQNIYGLKKEIGTPKDLAESYKLIEEYCKERNFEIYYIRTWTEDNQLKFDVGSHTEFFLLDNQI